jgi:hypothetical protein
MGKDECENEDSLLFMAKTLMLLVTWDDELNHVFTVFARV